MELDLRAGKAASYRMNLHVSKQDYGAELGLGDEAGLDQKTPDQQLQGTG